MHPASYCPWEAGCYPVCARYHMDLVGVPVKHHCRSRDARIFSQLGQQEMEDLRVMEEVMSLLI